MIALLKKPALCLLVFSNWACAQAAIDLSKPVSQSLKPDTLYWPCDGGTIGKSSPPEVKDLSGNGFTGKLLPGKIHPEPVYAAGKFGTALRFHGVTPPVAGDDGKETFRNPNPCIRWQLRDSPGMADGAKLDMAGKSFTAGLWIKVEKTNPSQAQSIMLMNRGFAQERQWGFMLAKDNLDAWTLRIQSSKSSVKTDAINDSAWHHLAFSLDSHDGETTVTYWLDGAILGEPVTSGRVIAEPESDAERVFRVGERNVANFSTGFAGLIDDIFVTSGIHTFQP
ncbi:MAG: LamG-like jellyroll fold domain-containing protein [Verrucomicrobiota bacterium]